MSLLDDDIVSITAIENIGFPNIDDIRVYDNEYNTIDFCDYCNYAKFYHWENEKYFKSLDSHLYFPTYYKGQEKRMVSFSSLIAVISRNKNYWVGKIYLCFKDKDTRNEDLFIYNEQERVVNRNSIVREHIMKFKIQNEPRKRWIYSGFFGFELMSYTIYGKTIKDVQTKIYRTLKLFKKCSGYMQFLLDMNNPTWEMIEHNIPYKITSPEELYKVYNDFKNI